MALPPDYATGKDRAASVRWRRADGEAATERMDEAKLLAIVRQEMDSAVVWGGGPANEQRRALMDLYLGAERGDERPGRSQVRSRAAYETVEWAKPALMAMFFGGPVVAEFQPQGEEDDEQAKQRTDTAHYVFLRQNRGFSEVLAAVTDALIRRIGWIKVWYERSLARERERYYGKTAEEMVDLIYGEAGEAEPEVEIDSATPCDPIVMTDDLTGERIEVPTWDVELTRSQVRGKVCVEAVPPSEIIVNREARSPYHPSCRFIQHRRHMSESEAMAMGFDPDLVRKIPTSTGVWFSDQEDLARATGGFASLTTSDRNDSERRIILNECYVRIDLDGDGISEWFQVFVGGDYGEQLIDAEPVSDHPFAKFEVIPLPHVLEGLSLVDSVADLQDIETTLRRVFLDNTYNLTQGRFTVQMSGGAGKGGTPLVNLRQLQNAIPSSWIEVWGADALKPLEQPEVLEPLASTFELLTQDRHRRTGISPEAMGVDPSMISKHVFGAVAQTSAAQQRIVLMALCIAEGVKRTFELIDRCLLMNQTQPMQIRLRGKWLKVDPAAWHGQMDAEIAVGISSGTRFEKAMNLQSLLELMRVARTEGWPGITDENIYNAFSELVAATGFRNTHAFVTDPATIPQEPPPEDPRLVEGWMKHHIETQKLALDKDKLALDRWVAEATHKENLAKIGAGEGASKPSDSMGPPPVQGQPPMAGAPPPMTLAEPKPQPVEVVG